MPGNVMFTLHTDANEKLLACVPSEWLDFFRRADHPSRDVVLCLREDRGLCDLVLPEGWNLITRNSGREAVFVSHEKANFSVSYDQAPGEVTVFARKALDGYVRSGILYGLLIALHQDYIGLHGVTLSCRGQTVILSAPSGTGKTTLSRLLEKYCGARVINGDFALLSVGEDGVIFEPTPFCGTSRVFTDERVRVDRIVFLEQSRENRWRDLSGRQSMICLMSNAFVPSFDDQLQRVFEDNILQLLPAVRTSAFAFAPEREAAWTFADNIEQT